MSLGHTTVVVLKRITRKTQEGNEREMSSTQTCTTLVFCLIVQCQVFVGATVT